ncbi:MAG: hypothetical protein BHV77_03880 [Bacteroides sp. 43_108]|nr:MAG: hypothetical protein BHV77_03880 [Bacteroides sp. 43_108]
MVAINILSCSNSGIQDKLGDISTYVCSNPDSARKELDKINKSELTTEKLRAHHALLSCESEYLTKCPIDDSTLNVASKYFVEGKNGTASQQMEAELLCIYKEIYNKPAEALTKLLEMEKNIESLSSPYFKAMVECFIMIIYYNNNEFQRILQHAYKELEYINKTHDINRIITSKNHIGIAYKNLNVLDSAYIYLSSYNDYENLLDSTTLSMAYHNLASLLDKIDTSNNIKIKEALTKSLKYNENIYERSRTYMKMASYYYETGEKQMADSFTNIFYRSVRNNDFGALYRMSRTINMYYEKAGNPDSANKYKGEMLKYRIKRDSAIRASRAVEITHQSELEEVEEDSRTRVVTISIIFAGVAGALLLGAAVYRSNKNKVIQEYSNSVEKLHKIQEELEEVKERERASKKAIASESRRLRLEIKRLTDMADTYSMKVLAMLTKNGCTDFKPTAAISEQFYTSINNVYNKTDKGKDFVKKITEACPSIKDRELFICLLYREGINNEKTISNILNVTDGTFRTIKSRLKKKLEEVPENCYINEILKSIGQ